MNGVIIMKMKKMIMSKIWNDNKIIEIMKWKLSIMKIIMK